MITKLFFLLLFCTGISMAYVSCRKMGKPCESCATRNESPIAVAGNDTVIRLPQDSFLLDGTASHDPGGNIIRYLWSNISDPSASSSIGNAHSAQTIIKDLSRGIHKIELTVTDNGGLSAKDTIRIVVDSVTINNRLPFADAGPDQLIFPTPELLFDGGMVLLDGSQSADPDHNIIVSKWSRISGASSCFISNADSIQTDVVFYEFGSYQFELKITDSGGLSSMDTIKISVNPDTRIYPPVANAGPDQTIFLTANNVMLDGTFSAAPNSNIISFQWTKISGPSSFNITDQNAVKTSVTSLVEGVYQFELKVTAANGLFSFDSVQVTVNTCGNNRQEVNATMTLIGNLSKPRLLMAVASAGNKILFAGGISDSPLSDKWGSSRVDIYDQATNTWSTAELSVARYDIAATAAGNKIFFAGGVSGEVGDLQTYYSTVDIYDVTTNTWSVAYLSERRVVAAAATVGNKVLFAGGSGSITIGNTTYFDHRSNIVDIYDITTNSWWAKGLDESKLVISAATLNDKVYFAGGDWFNGSASEYSDRIDIYDNASNTWSSSTLSEPKVLSSGIAAANKIYWAGGYNNKGQICKVEIHDVNTHAISFDHLSQPGYVRPVLKNNKISYHSNDIRFDIYDLSTSTWSIGIKPINRPVSSIISVNNTVYIAGGYLNNTDYSNEVWKLEF